MECSCVHSPLCLVGLDNTLSMMGSWGYIATWCLWLNVQSPLRPSSSYELFLKKRGSYMQRMAGDFLWNLKGLGYDSSTGPTTDSKQDPICHFHLKHHQIYWIIQSKCQRSLHCILDLFQNLLLSWVPLILVAFQVTWYICFPGLL